jgi:hypothetical protein
MGDVRRAAAIYRDATADPVASLPRLRTGVADPDALVRHVAAVQLAIHSPIDLPASAVRELLDTLLRVSRPSDLSPLTPEYAEATDDGEYCWDLGQHIALALAQLPTGSADFAVPELVGLWKRDRQFYEAVLAAVALSFPEGGRPVAVDLSESQRAVLAVIADDEPLWSCCGDTVPALEARGLPTSRHEMRSILASI